MCTSCLLLILLFCCYDRTKSGLQQVRKLRFQQCCCFSGLHVLYCDGGTRENCLTSTALDHSTLESFPHQTCERKKKGTSCPHMAVLWTDLDCDRQHNVVDCSLRNTDCVRARPRTCVCVCVCVRGRGLKIVTVLTEDCCLVGSDVMQVRRLVRIYETTRRQISIGGQ